MDNKKKLGQVYTPTKVVNFMLDEISYKGVDIIGKKIIDNSCGNGAFLLQIVERYLIALKKENRFNEAKFHLENYIIGIELDHIAYSECIKNLNDKVMSLGISEKIIWNIKCDNALLNSSYISKMDYVVGNPPYIRIHNIDDRKILENYSFTKSGVTDIYLAFFELGFSMLNENGVMSYITPDSFLTSKSGSVMRDYVYSRKLLDKLIDFNHFNPFKKTAIYPCISIFNKKPKKKVEYKKIISKNLDVSEYEKLDYDDFQVDNLWHFSSNDNLKKFRKIVNNTFEKKAIVKNGVATLCDNLFINEKYTGSNVIKIYKASTGKFTKIFFPYNHDLKLISESYFKKNNKEIYKFLLENKDRLLNRDLEDKSKWYAFGRTQGIKDINVERIAVSNIIKKIEDIKIKKINKQQLIYSGLYIITNISETLIKSLLLSNDFIDFCRIINKKKNGGFYTINSKYLEKFINYKLWTIGEEN